MKVYIPSDIADLLKIKVSTLRKHSILLEDAGVVFQRWYKNNINMKLKECAEATYFCSVGNEITPPSNVADNETLCSY